MTAHSSILALRIPWTEEPGGLQFKSCKILGVRGSRRASVSASLQRVCLALLIPVFLIHFLT